MKKEEENKVLKLMREARDKARGYADFFGWSIDRDAEELMVVKSLNESLESEGKNVFNSLKSRGRPNDPPDCEALNSNGLRIAIEVTELVDEKAIKNYKAGNLYDLAEWDKNKCISTIESLLSRKDSKHPKLKEPPYSGGYIIVVFTDEPMLNRSTIKSYLSGYNFKKPKHITQAFLIVSYDPSIEYCPHYELSFHH